MNIQSMSATLYTPDHSNSRVDSDPQVKRLEAQIKDWECCPTTDAKTKKQIVDKLETQLDSLKSSLERSESASAGLDVKV